MLRIVLYFRDLVFIKLVNISFKSLASFAFDAALLLKQANNCRICGVFKLVHFDSLNQNIKKDVVVISRGKINRNCDSFIATRCTGWHFLEG